MNEKTHAAIVKELKVEEGFRSTPYKDTVGQLTIGYGRNLHGLPLTEKEFITLFPNEDVKNNHLRWLDKAFQKRPITKKEAEYLLDNVIEICEKDAESIYSKIFDRFPIDVRVATIDLLYNLGRSRYFGFRKHIYYMKIYDFEHAADELLDSEAARQNSKRYQRLADMIRNSK